MDVYDEVDRRENDAGEPSRHWRPGVDEMSAYRGEGQDLVSFYWD